MRHKAEKLFSKICAARNGCVDLIMQAFEDVAVDFAWEILEAFKCGAGTTRAELKLSFDDYSKDRPVRQYPHYKTQVEIVKERKREYEDKKYGWTARLGIPYAGPPIKTPSNINIPDTSKQPTLWYMSPEDAEYLWACMPEWIKHPPGDGASESPIFYGTLSREGDLKVHNEVKRILNR